MTSHAFYLKSQGRSVFDRLFRSSFVGYGPMPWTAKVRALRRIFLPNAPIIETGTFMGQTARELAAHGFKVHTVEVSSELASLVFPKLEALGIRCYVGDSAEILPNLLRKLRSDQVREANFWLDGHWSGGVTGSAKQYQTPIVAELAAIGSSRGQLDNIVVAVDDVRCFGNDTAYPEKKYLVNWAEEHNLNFCFLADIFVASTEKYGDI